MIEVGQYCGKELLLILTSKATNPAPPRLWFMEATGVHWSSLVSYLSTVSKQEESSNPPTAKIAEPRDTTARPRLK